MTTPLNVTIAGGNGFIGQEVTRHLLRAGHTVNWLSYSPGRVAPPDTVTEAVFDLRDSGAQWRELVAQADVVVNLSGYPIASRWNPQVRELLRSSRLDTTAALLDAAAASRADGGGPSAYVGACGIGIFGDRGDTVLSEDDAPGTDWLAQLAVDWENAALAAGGLGMRAVVVRTGLVLGSEGLVPRLETPVRFFVGGPVGTGRQWASWIHLRDIAGIYRFVIENDVAGPVNAVAPTPVTMSEFMKAMGRVMHRPSWLPVPGFALRLILGEVAPYTLMSQRASADKIRAAGYRFEFEDVEKALADVLR